MKALKHLGIRIALFAVLWVSSATAQQSGSKWFSRWNGDPPIEKAELVTGIPAINEKQYIEVFGNSSATSTFVLSFGGQSTPPILVTASASTMRSALENLNNIDPGDIVVVQEAASPNPVFTVAFGGQYENVDVPQINASGMPAPGNVFVFTLFSPSQDNPVGAWSVMPLDAQNGWDLSRDVIPQGPEPWYRKAVVAGGLPERAQARAYKKINESTWTLDYHKYRYPIAAFGASSGGTPMYVGQAYRFAAVAGSQSPAWTADELVIKIYNKSTGQYVSESVIQLPNIPAATPGIDSEARAADWKAFADAGYQKQDTIAGILETTVQYVPTGVEWEKWGSPTSPFGNVTTYPLFITHRALSDEYGFVVAYNSTLTVGETASYPFSASISQNTSGLDVYSRAHGYLYAMDFDSPQPWHSTLVHTPHFNGKPLPPSYHGKTPEEIESQAPEVDFDFGDLFEGIRWNELRNFSSMGGGSGGTELTKVVPGVSGTWDATANAEKVFYGDGIVQFRFRAGASGTLALGPAPVTQVHGLNIASNQVYVIQNGTAVPGLAAVPYNENDVFSIQRIGVLVRFYKNGEPIYSSLNPSIGKLYINAFARSLGSILQAARYKGAVNPDLDNDGMEDVWELALVNSDLSDEITDIELFAPSADYDNDGSTNLQEYIDKTDAADPFSKSLPVVWTSKVNTTSNDSTGALSKTSGSNNTYDADAIGTLKLIGDGKVTFRVKPGSHLLVGFNIVNTNRDYSDLNYAWHPKSDGTLQIYEGSTAVGTYGSWNANTVFTIQRVGDTISYWKDDVHVHTSTAKNFQTIIVDTAFYTSGSEVAECRYVTGDNDGDEMLDAWEASYLGLNATPLDVLGFLPTSDPDSDGSSNLQEFQDGTLPLNALSKMEPVVWINHRNTQNVGTNGGLRKSAGSGAWDADAMSSKRIIGDGAIECVFGQTNASFVVGLTPANDNASTTDIEYALHAASSGIAYVYENGNNVINVGPYTATSKFRIERVDEVVKFYLDKRLVFTSPKKTAVPLRVDCSLISVNTTILQCRYSTGDADNDGLADEWELAQLPVGSGYDDVVAYLPSTDADGDGRSDLEEFLDGSDPANALSKVETIVWSSHVNTSSQGIEGGLMKTSGANNTYNADAISVKKIIGDGRVTFKASAGSHFLLGFNVLNTNQGYQDIDYAWHPQNGGTMLSIYESGATIRTVGTWDANTVLSIERVGDTVRYWKNGDMVHVSTTKSTGPLIVDTAFYTLNSSATEAYYVTGDLDGDELLDSWELAQLGSGATLSDLEGFLGTGDADGDGMSNLQEYRDGTDPSSNLSQFQPIVWTSHVNSAQGSLGGLKKISGGGGWNGGAVGRTKILGDGKVRFKSLAGSHLALGFNAVNLDNTWQDLDYAWHPQSSGTLGIYENGSHKFNVGNWNANTVLAIERIGDTIRYWKDGLIVYVSATKTTSPLLVDAALDSTNAELTEAYYITGDLDDDGMPDIWEIAQLGIEVTLSDLEDFIATGDADGDGVSNLQEYLDETDPLSNLSKSSSIVWTSHINTESQGAEGGLKKTFGGNAYDADAVSIQLIPGDGSVTFQGIPGSRLLVGLNNLNTTRAFEELEHAIFFHSTGAFEVWEQGVFKVNLGTWNADTVATIKRVGSTVKYLKNGQLVYTSTSSSTGTVIIDTAFYHVNSVISKARIINGDVDNDGMPDTWEIAQLGSEATLSDLEDFLGTGDADGDGMSNLQEYRDGTNPNNIESFFESVVWIRENGVQEGPNGRLIKISAPSAEGDPTLSHSGAVGDKVILGDGGMKFSFDSAGKFVNIGLGVNDRSTFWEDIEYGMSARDNNTIRIYESGADRGAFGSYVPSDEFQIRRIGSVISYWKNGVKIYTSPVPSFGGLVADAAIYSMGAGVSMCAVHGATLPTNTGEGVANGWLEPVNWINLNGATKGVAGSLWRSGNPNAAGDSSNQYSGAISQKLLSDTGRLWFRFAQSNLHVSVGLSKDEADKVSTKRTDIDYAIAGDNAGKLRVFESGVDLGEFGSYSADDILEIQRDQSSGIVSYWKNNVRFYQSLTPCNATLFADAAINSANGTIAECRLEGGVSENAALDYLSQSEQATTELLTLGDSPELRVHPILDGFVADMGRNPMALANFVFNEIELTDALGYNERGEFQEASVNAGGMNRGALATFQERQGSPAEQCALLVYLLRRAGYPAAYIFPETNSMTLLDSTLSKMLRMQVKGALQADGTSNVPHEIPTNYPWVAAYVDGKWVHLFPWLKDTEIKEGLNFWQYMPENINNPMAWIQKYIKRDPSVYDTQAADESPLETLIRKFQVHISVNHPGKDISDFGYSAVDRKHNFAMWEDFPQPWHIDPAKTPTVIARLSQRPGMFDTVEFQFRGINASGVKTDLQKVGPLRLLDLHNRRTIFRSDANNLTISTKSFHSGITGTGTYSVAGDLGQDQIITVPAAAATYAAFEVQITSKRHRYVAGAPLGESFLNVSEFSEQQTLSFKRHDLNAWCLNAGRVTPHMLRVHAEESWANNIASSPSAEVARNNIAYTMGLSYYQNMARAWDQASKLFKVTHVSTRAFGFGTLGAKLVNTNPVTYEQGYPILDMSFVRNVAAGGSDLRPDSGGQNKMIADWFTPFIISEISAQEHLTINRFFPDQKANAISTLDLLRRTPVANIIELRPEDYITKGNTQITFKGTTKSLKDWAGPQWQSVQSAFSTLNNDRDFTTIYMTPGPVNGAENASGVSEWNGVGTLILSRSEGGALIGQSLNGAFAAYLNVAAAAVKVVNTVMHFTGLGNLVVTYKEPPTPSIPQIVSAVATVKSFISYFPFFANYAALLDPVVVQSYAQSVFHKSVGSITAAAQQTIAGYVTNHGNFLKGIVNTASNMVSDPVNVLTGEFYHDTVDLTLAGGMPLQIRRNYGSRNTTRNDFGYGWKSSLMPYLLVDETGANIYAAEMDGNVVAYTRVGSSNKWVVRWEDNPELQNTENGRLHHNFIELSTANGKTLYRLKGHDGSLREYEVRSFPVTSGSTTVQRQRPYLNRWHDHSGNYYEFSYYTTPNTSDYGMLKRILSSSGSFVGFYYNVSGCVTEAFASDGRRIHYRYNNYGDLIEVQRPDGSKEVYEYALQDETVANSSPVRTEKISTHLLVKEIKPEGRVLINEYERKASDPTKYAESRRVLRQFSNVGKPGTGTAVDQPVPVANANDPVAESYEPRLSARFNYSNLVTDTTTKLSTGYVEVFDAYDRKTEYHYVDNRLTKVVDPMGYTTTTEYYPDTVSQTEPGGYRRSIKRTIDQRGLITNYKYDASGNPVETSVTGDLDGNPATTETAVSTTEYNSLHLPFRQTAPDPITGAATGKVTNVIYGYALDPYLPTETTISLGSTVITKSVNTYGEVGGGVVPFGRGLTISTSSGVDGDVAVTSWSYDRSGLPIQQIAYSGSDSSVAPNVVTRYRYNQRKEILESEDAAGRKTRYSYDNMGRRIWEERLDAAGKQVGWNYVYYNQNGEVEWTDGPRFAPEDYTFARYDGMGRVVEEVMWRSRAKADGTGVEEVPGPELYATTKKAYSLFGDLVKVTDPHGNTTRMKYDGAGRNIEVHAYQGDWQAAGTVLASTFASFNYELDGNNIPRDKSVTVTSPTGGITKTFHTQTGSPWKQENPDGTVLYWEYYLDGRLKKEPLTSHTYVLHTYDDAARTATKTTKNVTGATLGLPQVVAANARGQVVSATDAAGYQITSAYDKLGRVLQTTQPHTPGAPNPALAVGHIYDAAGVVAMTYNALNEKTVTTHDALGRPVLSQTLDSAGAVVSQLTTDYEPIVPGGSSRIKGQNAVQTVSGVGGEAIKSSVVFTDTAGATVLEIKQGGGYVRNEYDMLANEIRTFTTGNLDGIGGADSTLAKSTFDGLGRPLGTTMPDGAKVAMFYDYVRDGSNNIVGYIVERRMPGAAAGGSQPPVVGGLVEHQKFDAAGRIIEKSLKSGSSSTRNYVYHYHPANVGKDGGLLHYFEQQVTSSAYRHHTYAYDDWRRPDTYTVGTAGQSDYVKRTFAYDDPRSLVTALREDTVAGYSIINRVYDEQGRVGDEKVSLDGTVQRHLTNGYNAAGRRDSLAVGNGVPRLGSAAGGSYTFGWQANGMLKSVTSAGNNFNYSYQTNGLISSRNNAWRDYNVTSRDVRGRVTSTTTQITGVTGTVLAEGLTWLDDDRQASYSAQHGLLPNDAMAAWTDGRSYNYDLGRRRLVNEGFALAQGGSSSLSYAYDQGHPGLGIRTSAIQGAAAPADFKSFVNVSDNGATNNFARILREQSNHQASDFDAEGISLGALKVSLALEHANSESSRASVGPVSHPGPLDEQGAWRAPMRLWPGNYKLHARADHPSGNFSTSTQTAFTLQRNLLEVQNQYDEEGNLIERIWTTGSTTVRTQSLTWDGQGRLIQVLERDLNSHGYDWTARYDGLGRRVNTITQIVRANVAQGAAFEEGSWYDPLVEFLEIAVETRQIGVTGSERRTWKVHGPDANGTYGGLHGIGGLEALVEETDGAKTAVIDNYYGHITAHVEVATMTARWSMTRSQAYGPAAGSSTYTLNSGAAVIHTLGWQCRRMDVTGYYHMGTRYYDATGGRFLSPDPLGHSASMDLYSFSGGDPVNFVDPTGRYQRFLNEAPQIPTFSYKPPTQSSLSSGGGLWGNVKTSAADFAYGTWRDLNATAAYLSDGVINTAVGGAQGVLQITHWADKAVHGSSYTSSAQGIKDLETLKNHYAGYGYYDVGAGVSTGLRDAVMGTAVAYSGAIRGPTVASSMTTANSAARWTPPPGFQMPAVGNGRFVGDVGNSAFALSDNIAAVMGVPRGSTVPWRNGIPDFRDYAVPGPGGISSTFRVPGLTGDPGGDRTLMLQQMASQAKMTQRALKEWLSTQKVRLHHAGGEEVQIVPAPIHSLHHSGGAQQLRGGT
ncbi:hypothetical protein FEM03_05820 [Phragmitibacter flavus]|uniref:DUF6531 domain-containing protein n=1 Tax=Phragmitibacter flavus TaxID=2576071 RepID=A0A5R8KI42_9BACT|nr:RHS repeat-associated core domain-containing protein [Phragmitibacter flavus]TLD71655.1 hypothetical protein FEM03_05820 [Phragmitibacter flavus]